MVRTSIFPEWLGWLGIVVALLYLLGLVGRFWWAPLVTAQVVAFFLFISFVLLIGIRLFRTL